MEDGEKRAFVENRNHNVNAEHRKFTLDTTTGSNRWARAENRSGLPNMIVSRRGSVKPRRLRCPIRQPWAGKRSLRFGPQSAWENTVRLSSIAWRECYNRPSISIYSGRIVLRIVSFRGEAWGKQGITRREVESA